MFLSASKVRGLLESGDLKVEHAYVRDGDSFLRAPAGAVDLRDASSASAKLLLANLSGTRLQLTVGPLARSHHEFAYAGRSTFRGANDIVDIAAKGRMTIEPRETLTILTNEYVEFSEQLAGIVTPRVTMTDVGFLLTTAYIDPAYRGLLRVTLHNATDRRQTLRMCEPIAQLFVYRVSGDVDEDQSAQLASRSVFYGSNWKRVLDEEGEAFPRRKLPQPRQTVRAGAVNAGRSAKRHALTIVGVIVAAGGLGLLVAALIAYGSLKERLGDIDRLESQIESAQAATPLAGSAILTFRGGVGELVIPLPDSVPRGAVVLSEVRSPGASVVFAKVDRSGGRTHLSVRAALDNGADSSAEFVWAVLP